MGFLKKKIDWLEVIAYGLFILLVVIMITTAILSSEQDREIVSCRFRCIGAPPDKLFINGECWCDLEKEELNESININKNE